MVKDKAMAVAAITVDDGSRRVPIHNAQGEEIGSFVFHPTDVGIIQRYNDMVARFDGITAPLSGLDDGDAAGMEAALRELCPEIAVDFLFAEDASLLGCAWAGLTE